DEFAPTEVRAVAVRHEYIVRERPSADLLAFFSHSEEDRLDMVGEESQLLVLPGFRFSFAVAAAPSSRGSSFLREASQGSEHQQHLPGDQHASISGVVKSTRISVTVVDIDLESVPIRDLERIIGALPPIVFAAFRFLALFLKRTGLLRREKVMVREETSNSTRDELVGAGVEQNALKKEMTEGSIGLEEATALWFLRSRFTLERVWSIALLEVTALGELLTLLLASLEELLGLRLERTDLALEFSELVTTTAEEGGGSQQLREGQQHGRYQHYCDHQVMARPQDITSAQPCLYNPFFPLQINGSTSTGDAFEQQYHVEQQYHATPYPTVIALTPTALGAGFGFPKFGFPSTSPHTSPNATAGVLGLQHPPYLQEYPPQDFSAQESSSGTHYFDIASPVGAFASNMDNLDSSCKRIYGGPRFPYDRTSEKATSSSMLQSYANNSNEAGANTSWVPQGLHTSAQFYNQRLVLPLDRLLEPSMQTRPQQQQEERHDSQRSRLAARSPSRRHVSRTPSPNPHYSPYLSRSTTD
ncbi:unnamed protein product, partial [Amoebophrya sp. A25]